MNRLMLVIALAGCSKPDAQPPVRPEVPEPARAGGGDGAKTAEGGDAAGAGPRRGCEIESAFARWCGPPLGVAYHLLVQSLGSPARQRAAVAAAKVKSCTIRGKTLKFDAEGRVIEVVGLLRAGYVDGRLATLDGNEGRHATSETRVDGKVVATTEEHDADFHAELTSANDDECRVTWKYTTGRTRETWCSRAGSVATYVDGARRVTGAIVTAHEIKGEPALIATDDQDRLVHEVNDHGDGYRMTYDATSVRITFQSGERPPRPFGTWTLDHRGLPVAMKDLFGEDKIECK